MPKHPNDRDVRDRDIFRKELQKCFDIILKIDDKYWNIMDQKEKSVIIKMRQIIGNFKVDTRWE